ncbi:MAG: diguanylate cyclase (GGDEF)-like protein, partial [Myxococcota bacterium]
SFIGRGAWSGHVSELMTNLVFIGTFTLGGAILLRHEVRAVRRRTATGRTRLEEQVGEKAQTLGLDEPTATVSHPDVKARVAELSSTFQRTLALTRRAVRANSAVLLMREGADTFRMMEAATRETDLNRGSIGADSGIVAALLRQETDSGQDPVLRISPLEGRNAELPYYNHTPARIKSTMALTLRREDGTVDGILWFDRTAGEGFDERDAEYARVSGSLIARILETERTVIATAERSELLDRLADGSQLLSEALEPSDAYAAILMAAGRLTPLRFGALVQRTGRGKRLTVVHAAGDDAEALIGQTIAPGPSLPQVVVKTQAAMPPGFEWNAAHGPLLGSLGGPEIVEGEALLVLPLAAQQEAVGALVLIGTRPFEPTVVSTLQLLATQAAVLLRHADAVAELQSRASTDSLTALDNRNTMARRLDESLGRAGRLDHFKTVNDTHGHQMGDVVLQRVAEILRESKRVNDSAGRYGGEEFMMVLEGTTEAGARLVAERIRQKIQSLTFEGPVGAFQVSTSIGMAMAPRDGNRPEDVIKKADKALYQAKHAGRNRTRVYGQAIPAPALAPAPAVEAAPPM